MNIKMIEKILKENFQQIQNGVGFSTPPLEFEYLLYKFVMRISYLENKHSISQK